MRVKEIIQSIEGVISDARYEGAINTEKDHEELYKRLAQHAMRKQALIQFLNKFNTEVEFSNDPQDKMFRMSLGNEWVYAMLLIRNPTAKHKEVSIRKDDHERCGKSKSFIIFAVPQAADPDYYTDEIAKPTDEFSFYSASPYSHYDTKEYGMNIYYRLSDMEKVDGVKTKKIEVKFDPTRKQYGLGDFMK